jgi:hypothetical protein
MCWSSRLSNFQPIPVKYSGYIREKGAVHHWKISLRFSQEDRSIAIRVMCVPSFFLRQVVDQCMAFHAGWVSRKVRVYFGRKSRSKTDFLKENWSFIQFPCTTALLRRAEIHMAVRCHQNVFVFEISGLYHLPMWRSEQLNLVKKLGFPHNVDPMKHKLQNRANWNLWYVKNIVECSCTKNVSPNGCYFASFSTCPKSCLVKVIFLVPAVQLW